MGLVKYLASTMAIGAIAGICHGIASLPSSQSQSKFTLGPDEFAHIAQQVQTCALIAPLVPIGVLVAAGRELQGNTTVSKDTIKKSACPWMRENLE